ncbi:MAG: lactate utilization protein [Peptococcaceae bacterium]
MARVKEHCDALGQKTVDALKKNNFTAVYFSGKEEAVKYVLNFIEPGMKVGIGGSITLDQLELPPKAAEKGATVLNHNLPDLSPEEKLAIRREQLLCDVFLSSTNGITVEGSLVNIDGTGNRVGAMAFGPQKVIVIAGINKICRDEEAALKRIQINAAPQNNSRLKLANPCTMAGVCMDCKGKTRICNIYTVIRRKPTLTDMTVVIIGEELGY